LGRGPDRRGGYLPWTDLDRAAVIGLAAAGPGLSLGNNCPRDENPDGVATVRPCDQLLGGGGQGPRALFHAHRLESP